MSNIQSTIENIYDNTPESINKVMLGYKQINNQQTETVAIVYEVDKKKPLSELAANEVIPTSLNIDGITYPTDVVEDSRKIEFLTCYTNYSGDPEILRLQGNPSLLTPIMGGQEILQFPTSWTSTGGTGYSVPIGTLGFIAVDNIDNRVVGLTNAHVVCRDLVENSDRTGTQLTDTYNLYEQVRWIGNNTPYNPGAACRNNTSLVLASTSLKRYTPYSSNNTNYLDACVIGFNSAITGLITNNSYQIHRPTTVAPSSAYIPFATATEINNLLTTSGVRLYSTGRTTGPKGWGSTASCQLVVDAVAVSASVDGYPFADLIRFRYADNSNFPMGPGDSGSAVLASINGTNKIIGLGFAGNGGRIGAPNAGTHYGFICRIDRMATALNIRAWDASYVLNNTPATAQVRTINYSSASLDNPTIVVNGQTYWNAGLTRNTGFENV